MKQVRAIRHNVLGFFINKPGEGRTKGGIITLDDDGKSEGVKSRWFEVHDVGSDNAVTNDIKKGDFVLVAHGRWSRGIDIDHPEGKKMYSLDPEEILAIYEGDRQDLEYTTR